MAVVLGIVYGVGFFFDNVTITVIVLREDFVSDTLCANPGYWHLESK